MSSTYFVYQTSWLLFQLVSLLEQHVLDEPAFLWPKQQKNHQMINDKCVSYYLFTICFLLFPRAFIIFFACIKDDIFKLGHYFDPFFVVVVAVVVFLISKLSQFVTKNKIFYEARQISRHFSLILLLFINTFLYFWSLLFYTWNFLINLKATN